LATGHLDGKGSTMSRPSSSRFSLTNQRSGYRDVIREVIQPEVMITKLAA
jgi:hypothetical protein